MAQYLNGLDQHFRAASLKRPLAGSWSQYAPKKVVILRAGSCRSPSYMVTKEISTLESQRRLRKM